MHKHLALALLMFSLTWTGATAADGMKEPLWPEGAPGAKGTEAKDIPTLTTYLPASEINTGCGIVVCPGGGYGHLATGHEGVDIAEFWNKLGVAAFILEYRHSGRGYQHPAPLQDAQRALRTVRSRAEEYNLDPSHIGVMGFSAGGHLASSLGIHFDQGNPDAKDPIDKVSCRPDFMILCYPVIAFDQPYTHKGSQRNLLGKDAPAELVESMSSERQVTSRHTSHIPLSHDRRHRRSSAEQCRDVSGLARERCAGRDAHLPERPPRDWPGPRCPWFLGLASVVPRLAEDDGHGP